MYVQDDRIIMNQPEISTSMNPEWISMRFSVVVTEPRTYDPLMLSTIISINKIVLTTFFHSFFNNFQIYFSYTPISITSYVILVLIFKFPFCWILPVYSLTVFRCLSIEIFTWIFPTPITFVTTGTEAYRTRLFSFSF